MAVGALSAVLALALGVVRGLPQAAAAEASSCAAPVPENPTIAWIDPKSAKARFDAGEALAVDARPGVDFQQGHVLDALSLPKPDVPPAPAYLTVLRQAPLVIVYGSTSGECALAKALARSLVSAGIHHVQLLQGGFPRWLELGYPAQAGPCKLCPQSSSP
ncbi:MAG: rhodanese-like domain-containing protein [Polyangiales bacterium]